MTRPALALAGCLLALAVTGCGRYGAPVRPPRSAPAAAPAPAPEAPADPNAAESSDESTEP